MKYQSNDVSTSIYTYSKIVKFLLSGITRVDFFDFSGLDDRIFRFYFYVKKLKRIICTAILLKGEFSVLVDNVRLENRGQMNLKVCFLTQYWTFLNKFVTNLLELTTMFSNSNIL